MIRREFGGMATRLRETEVFVVELLRCVNEFACCYLFALEYWSRARLLFFLGESCCASTDVGSKV